METKDNQGLPSSTDHNNCIADQCRRALNHNHVAAYNKMSSKKNKGKSFNEKSSLVKNQVELAIDTTQQESIAPLDKENDYSELPKGIGTGDNTPKDIKQDDISAAAPMSSVDAVKGMSLAFIGAGIMYGLSGVFVRLAGEAGMASVEVLFGRSVFQSVIFGSTLLYKKIGLRPPPGRIRRCVLIAIFYCVATLASYEAFNIIPPGSAIATRGACRTIFSVLLAFIIAKEKVKCSDILIILCCMAGISLIISSGMTSGEQDYILPPGMYNDPTLVRVYGYSLIVLSGICRSLGLVAVRGAKDELNTFSVVFYHSSLAVILSAVLLIAVRQPPWPPSWASIGYLLGVCVTSSIATWSSNQAVKFVHPALVSLGQNADVVVSITLQHTILNIAPQAMEICGAVLILTGVSVLTIGKWYSSKKNVNE